MNKAFHVGSQGLIVTVIAASALYGVAKTENTDYYREGNIGHYASQSGFNEKLWHKKVVITGDTESVTDGTGTTFTNIPKGMNVTNIINHFKSKPEYKDHSFYPDDYTLITFETMKDLKGLTVSGTAGCVPWSYYINNNKVYAYSLDNYESQVNDYLNACAWGGESNEKDVSYHASLPAKAVYWWVGNVTTYAPWVIGLGILAMLPAIWLGFWRLVGMAWRSAKKSVKGEY